MELILLLCVQKTNYLQIIKNSDLLMLNLKSGKSIIHLYCFVYEILNMENFVGKEYRCIKIYLFLLL